MSDGRVPPAIAFADRLSVACGCGFVVAVPTVGHFLDAFEAMRAHLRTTHPNRTAVAITMMVTVTGGADA